MDAELKRKLMPLVGEPVTAKRAGWDEELSSEQELDLDPVDETEPTELTGRLFIGESAETEFTPAFDFCLVGGREADPKTVTVVRKGD